ncbi:MAG TPA: hypothetical protein VFW44_05630 [Bryobacteraceae bacterium]|nr:hypothetical protein [Bryobacteraceae bacterium]
MMRLWPRFRNLLAYLAPEFSALSPRKHFAAGAAFLALAAIAGAVVLKPSSRTSPDVWKTLHQRISSRALVDLFDDFSHGLDDWSSGQNQVSTWSYDRNGFVSVGTLSLYEPSLRLRDYDLDTLVEIESKGVGLVFRASSPDNYEVARLMREGSGPLPGIAMQHYSVIEGRASRPVVDRSSEHYPSDTMYRVHLEARGERFALYLQGHLLAYWSDRRLATGGVGLFCSAGEHARVAWVRVSQNTDTVGRVCSLLSSLM